MNDIDAALTKVISYLADLRDTPSDADDSPLQADQDAMRVGRARIDPAIDLLRGLRSASATSREILMQLKEMGVRRGDGTEIEIE